MTPETIGVKMNGTAMIGFITTGVANRIGSLILKKAGSNAKRPNCLN